MEGQNYLMKSSFSICFGGENEIELKTLINTLDATLELIEYVSNRTEDCAEIKVNVKDAQKGSFKVNFEAMVAIIPTLFTIQNINLAKTCIDTVCGLINIKKHLKGEKPKSITKEGEKVVIENNSCEKIIVDNRTFNFYNSQVDETISKIFSYCDREYYEIKGENSNSVRVSSEEYEFMKRNINIEEERVVRSTITSAFKVKKPDLTGNSQWELIDINNNKVIKATIEDEKFINEVHEGYVYINSKTTIFAELEIETTLNKYNESVKDVYKITKVLHLKNDRYMQLRI